jgi:predicted negative regulator of RcsB-dependent stress response
VEDYLSDKEQWEWLKGQVRENGPAVIIAIVLAVAAVFGWRWWQGHADVARLAAGDKYLQMAQALEHGDSTQAFALLAALEKDAPSSPYTDQARLLAARVYVDQGALDRAAAELSTVAEHSKDRELTLVARLRLARVQVAQGKADLALTTLGDPTAAGAFAAAYHEARGDAYYAKGDKSAALSEWHGAQVGADPSDAQLLSLKIADVASAAPAMSGGKPSPPTAGK